MPVINVMLSVELVNEVTAGNALPLSLILLWALSFSLSPILAPINSGFQALINDRVTRNVQLRIMGMAAGIKDLATLHDSEMHDCIELLSRESHHRPLNTLVNVVEVIRSSVTMGSLCILLASFIWWLPLFLLLPLLPVAWTLMKTQMDVFKEMLSASKESRFFKYYFKVVLNHKYAEDIRIFNLFSFFQRKYVHHYDRYLGSMKNKRIQMMLKPQPWNLIYFLSISMAIFWLTGGMSSTTTSGQLVGLIQAMAIFSAISQGMTYNLSVLPVCIEYFRQMRRLENTQPLVDTSQSNQALPENKTVVFEEVSFHYPDGRKALSDINLTLESGEKVALVGENGAGKTTLVKLLCRFYDPSEGRITVGGVDLRHLNLDEWREYIGAVFQDFGRYHLTVGENIALGYKQQSDNSLQLADAARKARFELSDNLNLDSQLGAEFDGTELSGGQWQRLALARTVNRDCGLVILDEPTSAMDPRVEAELFEQFTSLMANRTALMVTHRLGSVALLERVLVLKSGHLIEDGQPAVLEAKGGEYAELWKLQSVQYQKQAEATV